MQEQETSEFDRLDPEDQETIAALRKVKSNLVLTASEKQKILVDLKAVMNGEGMPAVSAKSEKGGLNNLSVFAFSFKSFKLSFSNKYVMVALVVLVVVGSSVGISQAAEKSLPGDFLYPVKTNINEKIKVAAANSPTEKAQVEAKLTLRRLAEAEILESQGRLDEQKYNTIVDNISEHSAQTDKNVTVVRESGDVEAAAKLDEDLDLSLTAHIGILNRLSQTDIHPSAQGKAVQPTPSSAASTMRRTDSSQNSTSQNSATLKTKSEQKVQTPSLLAPQSTLVPSIAPAIVPDSSIKSDDGMETANDAAVNASPKSNFISNKGHKDRAAIIRLQERAEHSLGLFGNDQH